MPVSIIYIISVCFICLLLFLNYVLPLFDPTFKTNWLFKWINNQMFNKNSKPKEK
nr:MAG TPA: hypothetical protein [Caudoviricetes sp.]